MNTYTQSHSHRLLKKNIRQPNWIKSKQLFYSHFSIARMKYCVYFLFFSIIRRIQTQWQLSEVRTHRHTHTHRSLCEFGFLFIHILSRISLFDTFRLRSISSTCLCLRVLSLCVVHVYISTTSKCWIFGLKVAQKKKKNIESLFFSVSVQSVFFSVPL